MLRLWEDTTVSISTMYYTSQAEYGKLFHE